MPSPYLILGLLGAISLCLGSFIEPWYQSWGGGRNNSAHVLNLMIGDSRSMLANHFFAKADAYFHRGYYPTIFDTPKPEAESHMTGGDADEHEHEHHDHGENEPCEHEDHAAESEGYLEPPTDWIDRFSRNFFPSRHQHLEKEGAEREILPWLSLSADLDPERVETYTIASYWLRSRLGKVDEAEQFLRQGIRVNPESSELYFELGRIYSENRSEPKLARNLWEVALRKWNAQLQLSEAQGNPALKPDVLVYEGITGRLARLEEAEGNLEQAIHYLRLLKEKSPFPQQIQKQIDELSAKTNAASIR